MATSTVRVSRKMIEKELSDTKFSVNILRLDKSNLKGDIQLAITYLEDGAPNSALRVLQNSLKRA